MRTTKNLPRTSGLAIPAMVGAAALIAITSIIGKALGIKAEGANALHPLQVSAGRFAFAILTLAAFAAVAPRARPDFRGANWRLHFLRSACGWSGVTAMFAAVAQMPVAEATAISFLSPIVTLVLAALLLNEHVGLRKIFASCCALTGASLILRPGTEAFQIAGLFALFAAALMGLEAIFIKRLTGSEPPMRILIVNNLMGSLMGVIAASFVWEAPTSLQWGLLALLGVVMVSGQSLFIQAMKRGEASLVMPAFYFVLVFAALYDFALFGVWPSLFGMSGSAMIIFSAVFISRVKP